jgi:hypothetical protein
MSNELHPLALEFVNTQINFKEIAPGVNEPTQKPIRFVLLNLSTKSFGYIDVMQDYINLMNIGLADYGRFHALVENICKLARRHRETEGHGSWKFKKDEVLLGLNYDEPYVPIQIDNAVMQNDKFSNPIFYTVRDADPTYFSENKGNYQGGMGPFFIKLLRKIYETVDEYDYHDVLLAICRHLNEQVVPMLHVLTEIYEKKGGKEFIKQLDLIALVDKLRQIQELERTQAVKQDLMRTSSFNANLIIPQVKSLVADKQFLASGNASQTVIGDSTFSAKGGRRTKRNKKRSGHKRSDKRSNKRSGKRSGKRSVHKSRRR